MHSNNEQEANIINGKGLVQFLIDRKEERADEVIKKYGKNDLPYKKALALCEGDQRLITKWTSMKNMPYRPISD